MNGDGPDELSRIMYGYIIGPDRTANMPTVEQIAERMMVRPVTVYKWLEGENAMPFPVFSRLYRYIEELTGTGPATAASRMCERAVTSVRRSGSRWSAPC